MPGQISGRRSEKSSSAAVKRSGGTVVSMSSSTLGMVTSRYWGRALIWPAP